MAFSRLEILWLLVGEMVYVYYVVLRLKEGLPRLLALVPVITLSVLLPWRPPIASERILYSFVLCWTIMSKLLLLVWDKGSAVDPHAISSFPRFFSAMVFSLHLKRDTRFTNSGHLQGAAAATAAAAAAVAERDDGKGTRTYFEVPNGVGSRNSSAVAKSEIGKVKNGDSNGMQQFEEELQHIRRAKQEKHSSWPRWLEIVVNSQAGRIVLLRSVFYFIVAASLIRMVQKWRYVMPTYVLTLPLGFIMYFSALCLFDTTAGTCGCLLGTELHPQFNMPFLSDSLTDFWGRRWNLTVNNLIRVSIYEPMLSYLISREGGKKKPLALDRAIATFASFTVSGLAHELIFFYSNKSRPTWEMTAFFVLNGVATVVEGFVKPRQRFGLPRILGWAYTMIFVYVTAWWLFFPPILRTGMVDQSLADLHTFSSWISGMVMGRLQQRI